MRFFQTAFRRIRRLSRTGALMVMLCSIGAAMAFAQGGFLSVTGPCDLDFPKDHGPHPGFRTEWWYYTGNLLSDDGDRFGFQLTFFRSQTAPSSDASAWPDPPSAWRTQQIYAGHAAVSDISGESHHQAQVMARSALGMAGADVHADGARIYLNNWSADITASRHALQAGEGHWALDLQLVPAKPPVFHGVEGYSRKGASPDKASCYYSFTRLATRGTLTVQGIQTEVTGLSWMDHEFSTAPLEKGIVGWDWFSLQLTDQTEIMVFLLRKADGGLHPVSSGTFIAQDGRTRHLAFEDFEVTKTGEWRSSKTRAVYPSQWEVRIAPLSLFLKVSANLADQEMQTAESTGVTYWEGSVSCTGRRLDQAVTGSGYVELTGYAGAFDADL